MSNGSSPPLDPNAALSARARIVAGVVAPSVDVVDSDDRRLVIPSQKSAQLIVYEEKDASSQNEPVHVLSDRMTNLRANHGRIAVIPVADVEAYNFFPAQNFVREAVRKLEQQFDGKIYIDWTAAVRSAWGLTRGKSGIILVGADARVKFVGEGPLSSVEIEELRARLTELGVELP